MNKIGVRRRERAVSGATGGSNRRGPAPGGGSADGGGLPDVAERLFAALARPEASAVPDPTEPDMLLVRASRNGVSLGAGRFPSSAADALVRRDLAAWSGEGTGRLRLSDAGRARSRRLGAPDDAFRRQHGEVVEAEVAVDDGRQVVAWDAAESPLLWLHRRRDRGGEPLIDAAAFEAGERLRRDLTTAAILPRVTMSWDRAGGPTGGGAPRDAAGATVAAIAARQRATAALEAVGPDFADLLLDLCGFLKGLEAIERERDWPPRSGKVVVRLALARLADHYGLKAEARGPSASRGIRTWRAVVIAGGRAG